MKLVCLQIVYCVRELRALDDETRSHSQHNAVVRLFSIGRVLRRRLRLVAESVVALGVRRQKLAHGAVRRRDACGARLLSSVWCCGRAVLSVRRRNEARRRSRGACGRNIGLPRL